jgi:hypothetical protein
MSMGTDTTDLVVTNGHVTDYAVVLTVWEEGRRQS